jgi:hypothetical protein
MASMEMPDGPVNAVGDTRGDAKSAVEQLLVIARAIEVTRRLQAAATSPEVRTRRAIR